MPREDRRIIFNYEETYKAVYALCVQKEIRRPPPGCITAITADPADEAKIMLKIDNVQENTAHDLELGRDFLAAALMLLCRSQGIPMPKKAGKSVEFKADSVILRMII